MQKARLIALKMIKMVLENALVGPQGISAFRSRFHNSPIFINQKHEEPKRIYKCAGQRVMIDFRLIVLF